MITIDADALSRAMKLAASIVDTRNTIPILGNVLLRAADGEVELATTNLDIELRQKLAAQIEGDLAVTVDARRFALLAAAVQKGAQVALELAEDGRLLVKSGRSRWHLPVLPAQDFPQLPFEGDVQSFTVPAKALDAAIARTEHTVSTEEARYYLRGTYLDTEDGHLRLVSTNGAGMTCVTLEVDHAPPPDLIVPRKFLSALRALEGDGDIPVEYIDKRMRVRVGDAVLTGKTIDGTYPDYRRAFPSGSDQPVRFDPAAMRAALRRVVLVIEAKTRLVKLEREAGRLVVTAADQNGGAAREELPCEGEAGHTAGFDAQYLDNMLAAIGGDTIELHHADAGAPAMFRRVPADGAVGVLMPHRI